MKPTEPIPMGIATMILISIGDGIAKLFGLTIKAVDRDSILWRDRDKEKEDYIMYGMEEDEEYVCIALKRGEAHANLTLVKREDGMVTIGSVSGTTEAGWGWANLMCSEYKIKADAYLQGPKKGKKEEEEKKDEQVGENKGD